LSGKRPIARSGQIIHRHARQRGQIGHDIGHRAQSPGPPWRVILQGDNTALGFEHAGKDGAVHVFAVFGGRGRERVQGELVEAIAEMLSDRLGGGGAEQVEAEQAAVGVEFGQRGQVLRAGDAVPQQARGLAQGVERIITAKEAILFGLEMGIVQGAAQPHRLDQHIGGDVAQGFGGADRVGRGGRGGIAQQRAQGLGKAGGRFAVGGRDFAFFRQFAHQFAHEIHRRQKAIDMGLIQRDAALANIVHQVFGGVQHAGHVGQVEQARIALERMHEAEQLVHRGVVGGVGFEHHDLCADAGQQFFAFGQKLREQRVDGGMDHAAASMPEEGGGPTSARTWANKRSARTGFVV